MKRDIAGVIFFILAIVLVFFRHPLQASAAQGCVFDFQCLDNESCQNGECHIYQCNCLDFNNQGQTLSSCDNVTYGIDPCTNGLYSECQNWCFKADAINHNECHQTPFGCPGNVGGTCQFQGISDSLLSTSKLDCTKGQTGCGQPFGAPYNTCDTNNAQMQCKHNSNGTAPNTCTTCNQKNFNAPTTDDNCDGGAGYACGGGVCRKTMSGRVTDTETGNGIQGVTVTTTAGTDTTDNNGNWGVGGFGYLQGFTLTPSNGGSPCNKGYVCGGNNPTSPNPGNRAGTVGGGGDCGNNCNFTYTPGHISGHVYIDYDHDGNRDNGDIAIAGVTVSANNPNKTDVTDGNGAYDIGYLNDGAHTVTITVPAGYAGVTITHNVTIGPNNNNTNFYITPLYTISGNVFSDINLNQTYNAGIDSLFDQSSTIHFSGGPSTVADQTQSSGIYSSGQALESGNYTVSLTSSLPAGWRATTPTTFLVTVGLTGSPGPQCDIGGSLDGICGAGSITNLDFGLTNETAWKQPICGDTRYNSGYSEAIPATAACNGTSGPYAIMNDSNICPTNPGILFSGSVNPDYGTGTGASSSDLQVGNTSFPESFNYRLPNTSDTSYSFVNTTITTQGTPTIPLTSICPNLATCTISEGTPGGIYTTTAADGPVSISVSNGDASYNLGQANYSFVIGADLTFETPLTLQASSAAIFTSGGNIHVDGHVGNVDYTSTSPDLEGFFSADQNFDIDTLTSNNNICQASGQPIDKKLNIKGSVIAGAGGSGSVLNNREGCVEDLTCPNITVNPDPLQLLRFTGGLPGDSTNYAGGALKTPYSFWQELNP